MSDAYKKAGVDIKKGYESVNLIKKHIAKTNRKEVMGGIGSFGGLFDLSHTDYQEPVLISGTDGVGTKLLIAQKLDQHHTIGIDLVAMCVNDIVAQGAEPLFFLDYIGCGQNDPKMIEQIVSGIANGCEMAGCALIGGETAEMPGMYEADQYDLAGFAVGVAEKSHIITGDNIEAGDQIIGLASSGIHSNGYSLVRQIIEGYDLEQSFEGLDDRLGQVLLEPTRIYAQPVHAVLKEISVKGIVHITGGGFYENFSRIVPVSLGVELDASRWNIPAIFHFLKESGELSDQEMYGVFNMGIGLAMIVGPDDVDRVLALLEQVGEEAYHIGKVIEQEGVHIQHDS